MPTNKPEVVLPEQDLGKTQNEQGLFRKYEVRRTDGSDFPGGKHDGCEYFVLDMTHDPHAKAAAAAYADSAEMDYPDLAADMRGRYGLDTLARPAAAPQQHGQEVVAGWSRELLKDLHERLVRSGISDHLDGGSNKAADRAYIKAAITEVYGLIADLLVTTHSESQQPAEAVADSVGVCKWRQQDDGYDLFSTSCGHEYMVNDCTDGNVGLPYCPFCARRLEGHAWAADDEAHPVFIAPLTPTPAIDIGKLRELVARWRADKVDDAHSTSVWDQGYAHARCECADELAALIGDGGEKGNG